MSTERWERVEQLELAARNLEEKRLDANILCARCQRSTMFRRKGKLHMDVYCHSLERYVPDDIAECSGFSDAKAMSLTDMERMATIIDTRQGVNKKAYL